MVGTLVGDATATPAPQYRMGPLTVVKCQEVNRNLEGWRPEEQ